MHASSLRRALGHHVVVHVGKLKDVLDTQDVSILLAELGPAACNPKPYNLQVRVEGLGLRI